MSERNSLFLITPQSEQGSLLEAIERSMHDSIDPLTALPALSNVALGDPYLAEQLAALHRLAEIRPPARSGLIGRLRTRLAWWLSGAEFQQATAAHAALVRVIDSLIVQLDEERAARRRIEEQLAYAGEER